MLLPVFLRRSIEKNKKIKRKKEGKNMWENISSFIAIIGSLIAICTTIYKKIFKNGFKREQEYYRKVLLPYVEKNKSGNANALHEIIIQIKRTDEYIPKYIWYLIDKSQNQTDNATSNDDLHKVLIYDYLDIYPNDDNMMGRLAGIVTKIATDVMTFLAFIILVFGSIICVAVFNKLFPIGTGKIIDLAAFNIKSLQELFLGIGCMVVYVVTIYVAMIINQDRYTAKKKKIETMINRKVKDYDKHVEDYVY